MFATLPVPESSAFVIEVDADNRSSYSISLKGQEIQSNTLYRTAESFYGTLPVEIDVSWVDGEKVIHKTFILDLRAGCRHTIKVKIPRVFPRIVKC